MGGLNVGLWNTLLFNQGSVVPPTPAGTVTVQSLYNVICFDLLEDGGLTLGLLTIPQFIDLTNLTLLDFLKEACLYRRIFTQTVFAGESDYGIPDDIERVDHAFLAGRYLGRSTVQELNNESRKWRFQLGVPSVFHTDEIPVKTMELVPVPNFNGSYIPGPNEPDGPHGIYGSFSATVNLIGGGTAVQNPSQHRGVTTVGTQKPTLVAALSDPIPLLPAEWALSYLLFGVLQRIFGGDNELKDVQRELWCGAIYKEGISLAHSIMGEPDSDEGK